MNLEMKKKLSLAKYVATHVLCVAAIVGIYYGTMAVLDMVMMRLIGTNLHAIDYEPLVLSGGVIGLALAAILCSTLASRKDRRPMLVSITTIAYVIVVGMTAMLVANVIMRLDASMLYNIDHSYWLLAAWIAGLLGGHLSAITSLFIMSVD